MAGCLKAAIEENLLLWLHDQNLNLLLLLFLTTFTVTILLQWGLLASLPMVITAAEEDSLLPLHIVIALKVHVVCVIGASELISRLEVVLRVVLLAALVRNHQSLDRTW